MPVISNTSPLLNLAIINQLHLVREQFRDIIIPNAVLKELRINENIPGSLQLREAKDNYQPVTFRLTLSYCLSFRRTNFKRNRRIIVTIVTREYYNDRIR